MSTKVCCSKSIRFMVWLLVFAFFLPAPMAVNASPVPAYASDSPANAHVLRRLNSSERAAAIAEAARLDAIARESHERGEAVASAPSVPSEEKTEHPPAPVSRETAAVTRPQSVTEVLFNHGASFLGVPGLAPQRGVDGSLDEGLGFHQDGTARKAGGVAASSGPSANGQRARSYMQTGLQNGNGMAGYAPGLYDASHDALWGRDDSTRGGRVSSSSGYSRELGDFDPMNMAVDRGLNYGAGLLNSAGEAALSGLVDGGRARLNFRLDKDGYFNGEGDALLPFYDGKHTTVYTQLGARSMHDSDDTRWIGNFGLGQRWFPFAEGDDPKSGNYDAGMLMLGYNAFFDYDLTRDHQRGGFGAEVWYDWLRLSSNYYFPLSGWKGSEDFDSRFVKERAAEGWDARVKAYLPFYRHIALTGAYSQWYGDHVGVFGASKLEKDPKVWSYGIEYTPVPLVSGFITQKSTERGRSDTEFGLTFTYHFQMPWEDQISPAKVTELRTVGGSRHEFVDRENKIILEYKAKDAYHIEYLGQSGSNTFRFRIRNGFDEFKAGQTVRVSASGVTLAEAPAPEKSILARAGGAIADFFSVSSAHAADFSQSYTTDSRGEFLVTVSSPVSGPITLTVQAGSNTQSFTVNVTGSTPAGPYTEIQNNNAPADNSSLITAKARFFESDGTTPASGQTVSWSVQGVTPAGIILGTATQTDSDGWSSIPVKDGQTGNRSVPLEASYSGTTRTITVSFGSPVLSLSAIAASSANPAISSSSNITVDVKFADGNVAANMSATSITWATRNNASPSATETRSSSGTDGSGKAPLSVSADFQHVMYVEASAGSSSQNITVQFGPTLPSGFIVGPGDSNSGSFIGKILNWSDAGAFCASQGGQLPALTTYTVAGGFPYGNYWSRQEFGTSNAPFLHGSYGGLNDLGSNDVKSIPYQVVCVP